MKGDYYRYLAEVATGETRNSKYLLRVLSVFCVSVLYFGRFCVVKVVDTVRAHNCTYSVFQVKRFVCVMCSVLGQGRGEHLFIL